MERRGYRDEFEKYLKDQSHLCKMYPSKKVWHGIYNNIHPGKKWPSATSSFFIVLFLLIMNNFTTAPVVSTSAKGKVITKTEKTNLPASNSNNSVALAIANNNNPTTNKNLTEIIIPEKYSASTPAEKRNIITFSLNGKRTQFLSVNEEDKNKTPSITAKELDLNNKIPAIPASQVAINNLGKKTNTDKFSLSYFVTPTVSYRAISNSPTYAENDITGSINQQMAVGFEVGSNLNYQFSKKLRISTGVQFNYSGYDIAASSIHPQETTLILNDEGAPKAVSAVSYYGNQPGTDSRVTLHNYSLQASIPIGMQYTIAGNKKLSISAGASVQPFYVISSNAYILASDGMSYVNYPSLLRDFNVNTEFGTYVTFKASKFNWQVGPHLSYQLLSTYTSNSPYSEHLINYGLRFGISKSR